MTSLYHRRDLPRNDLGLPGFLGLPLFDWAKSAQSRCQSPIYPDGLTAGGRIVYRRTRRPVSTCNTICATIDFKKGWKDPEEPGPVHREYCLALGRFAASNWRMSLDEIFHAFNNPGGVFLRGFRDDQ